MHKKTINRVVSVVILLIAIHGLLSCTQRSSSYLPTAFKFDNGPGPVYYWGNWITDGNVYAITRSGSNVYIGGTFSNVYANSGGGAHLSAETGMMPARTRMTRVAGTVNAVAADGRGGWYIGGNFSSVGNRPKMNIAHIRPDGTVDDWNPIANNDVLAIAVSGNTVYVGGSFNDGGVAGVITIGGRSRNYIAALDAGTGVATDWNPNANSYVRALAVSGDIIYAGGDFSHLGDPAPGGTDQYYIAAIDRDTGGVTGWNPYVSNIVRSIVVSGPIVYIGGEFFTVGPVNRNYIASVEAGTGNVTPWDPNANGAVYSMALSGTTLYAGGYFTSIGGQARNYLAALDTTTDSNNATSWDPASEYAILSLAVSGDYLYAGGIFTYINFGGVTYPRYNIASFDLSTGMIRDWDPHADDYVFAIAVVPGRVFIGGDFSAVNIKARNKLAAVDVSTGLLTDWDPKLIGASVNAMAADSGRVYAGGVFTGLDYFGITVPRDNIAAIDAETGWPILWEPRCDNTVYSLAVDRKRVYAGGTFTQITNPDLTVVARSRIAAIDKSTGYAVPAPAPGSGWDAGANGVVNAMVLDGGMLYAGGGFTTINGSARNNLAVLDAATGVPDAVWDPNITGGDVNALALYGSSLYVGGNFTGIAGISQLYLGCVSTDDGALAAWDPAPDGSVHALKISGGRLFVGGNFISMAVNPPLMPMLDYFAIFDLPSGALDYFRTHLDSTVFAVDVYGGAIYLGGIFTGVNGSYMPFISAISSWNAQPIGY